MSLEDGKYPNVEFSSRYEVCNQTDGALQIMVFDKSCQSANSYTLKPRGTIVLNGWEMTELLYRLVKKGKIGVTKK
jgi:hypothetical protein